VEESSKFLAEILGVSERRVNQIATEGIIFQREANGKFNVPVCVQKYFKDKYTTDTNDLAKKLKYEAKLKKQKAEEAEFKTP
jgi:NADH:ubiquinone oxidoreductase subunit E